MASVPSAPLAQRTGHGRTGGVQVLVPLQALSPRLLRLDPRRPPPVCPHPLMILCAGSGQPRPRPRPRGAGSCPGQVWTQPALWTVHSLTTSFGPDLPASALVPDGSLRGPAGGAWGRTDRRVHPCACRTAWVCLPCTCVHSEGRLHPQPKCMHPAQSHTAESAGRAARGRALLQTHGAQLLRFLFVLFFVFNCTVLVDFLCQKRTMGR